jgi:acyl carrier protein
MSDAASVPSSVLETFRSVLAQPELELTRATTATDVVGWDSLSHIQILVALEREYGVRFTAAEIADLKDVGSLCDVLAAKSGTSA